MRKLKHLNIGFTLIEVMIGMALMVTFISAGVVVMKTITIGSTQSETRSRVDHKLQSVAERIRYEAASRFDFMDETEADRTGNFDPKITILSTIKAVDALTRTREVVLKAIWMEGQHQREKSMTFGITQTKANISGTTVLARIVKIQQPFVGVPGVKVSAPGEDESDVFDISDEEGYIRLLGVKVAQSGISLLLDGGEVKSYFMDGGPTYTQFFDLGETRAASLHETYLNDPIKIYPPAVLTGVVTDVANMMPAPSVQLKIYHESTIFGSNSIMPTEHAYTDESGAYSLTLLPGQYLVYLMSYGAYAGVARPGDESDNHNSSLFDPTGDIRINLNSNQVGVKNFDTVKKGGIKGRVYGVNYFNFAFNETGPVPENVHLKIYRHRGKIYDHPSETAYDLIDTNNYQVLFHDRDDHSIGPVDYVKTDPDGDYILNDFVPAIVYPESDMKNQYTIVRPRPYAGTDAGPREWTLDPYVPVRIIGPTPDPPWNKDDVKLLSFEFGEDDDLANPYSLYETVSPKGTDITDFDLRVFTNGFYNSTNPDHQDQYDIYLLEKTALSNVEGEIMDLGGQPFLTAGTVRLLWADDQAPYGGMTFRNFNPDRLVFDPNRTIDSEIIGVAKNKFDFELGGDFPEMEKTLIPTIGTDNVILEFRFESNPENLPVTGWVAATRRIANNGDDADWEPVPANEVNISNLNLVAYAEDDLGISAFSPVISVTDGQFSFVETVFRETRRYITNPFPLPPGDTVDVDIKVDTNDTASNLRRYFLRAEGDEAKDWLRPSGYYLSAEHPDIGELFTYDALGNTFHGTPLILYQTGVTGEIYGTIVDGVTGEPVIGAKIYTVRSGYYGWAFLQTTVESTGPGGAYHYFVNQLKFNPQYRKNIRFYIVHPSYQEASFSIYAYYGYTGEVNFALTPVSVTSSAPIADELGGL